MTQNERLDYLVEEFKTDSVRYKDLTTPSDTEGKRQLLRSLMNIRMPGEMDESVLEIQDDYLVDAIVNAANSQMLGCFVPMHTCIDNCIHTFAGIQLRAECSRQMKKMRARYGRDYEQPTAVPMLTDAYNLPAKKVIHVVGPIVQDDLTPELEQDLADCYTNTLELCAENDLRSVAFCCISTGVFRFPNKRAAEIAVHTVKEWLVDRVIFNVFKDEDRRYYESELQ